MEEIDNDEIEQVAGGTAEQQRSIQEFLERFSRERSRFPMPVPDPFGW